MEKNNNGYYSVFFDWSSCYSLYEKHYNSNPYYGEYREVPYTFFADMTQYVNFNSGEKLIKELKSYINRMLKMYCKGNRDGYCVMIDSVCLLTNLLWSKNNKEVDSVIKWLGETYQDMFYNEKTYSKYVSEEEMMSIWRELN